MTFTKRISIERYKGEVAEQSAGLIEGETEDGQRWIIFMDAQGRPEVCWPTRDSDGGVEGSGIPLTAEGIKIAAQRRMDKMREILDADDDPAAVVKRLRGALDAADRLHAGDPEVEEAVKAILKKRRIGPL